MKLWRRRMEREVGHTFTHAGWFGPVPVYVYDNEGEFIVAERVPLTGWLVTLTAWMHVTASMVIGIDAPFAFRLRQLTSSPRGQEPQKDKR